MADTLSEQQFSQLVAELKQLPPRKGYSPTFLQMAGIPDWENVWSNILAFYLDSSNGHGLGNVVFRAFMGQIDVEVNSDVEIKARREEIVEDGKRLDLVLETPDMVIGIENKVNHILNNDLAAYRRHLEGLARGREVHSFVLSRYAIPEKEQSQAPYYHYVTYDQFCTKLRQYIDFNTALSRNKYMMFLDDFIISIARSAQGESMDPERVAFFKKNLTATQALLKEIEAFREELKRKAKSLKLSLERETLLSSKGYVGALWSDMQLIYVLYYLLAVAPDLKIQFNIVVGANDWIPDTVGWALHINHEFGKSQTRIQVKQWFDARQIKYTEQPSPWRLIINDPTAPAYAADNNQVHEWVMNYLTQVLPQ